MARRDNTRRLIVTPEEHRAEQQKRVRIPYMYNPRSHQRRVLAAFDQGCKRAVLVHHRRAGKDKTMLQVMIKKMVRRVGTYFYFMPTFNQGRKILWDGMDDNGFPFMGHFPADMIKEKNESEMQVALHNGSIFQIIGTDKIDHVVGTNPIFAGFSEYSIQNPKAWQLISPIIKANGGDAMFVYTPRGKNHGWDLYKNAKREKGWFTELLTVDQTQRDACDDAGNPLPGETGGPIITLEQIEEDRRMGVPEEIIQQEYYCSFEGAMEGSYYGEALRLAEREGRITKVAWEQDKPVYTAWDLGASDNMALWFYQRVGREIHFVDCHQGGGKGLPYYVRLIKEEKAYIYERHKWPHDATHTEIGTGKTRLEQAYALGLRDVDIVPKIKVDDGISAVRLLFPRFWFDEVKCEPGLNALRNYRKEWDDKRKQFKDVPYEDWSSHFADALRTTAVGFYDPKTAPPQDRAETKFNVFTYEDGRRDVMAEYDRSFNPFDA